VSKAVNGGLACVLALLLAACAGNSSPSTSGPFGSTNPNSGMICSPARTGGVAYDGQENFPDTGGKATIEKVSLAHPRHLHLVAAWVIRTPSPGIGVGVGPGYPTAANVAPYTPGLRWISRRQPAVGAVIRHTKGTQTINLVIVAKTTGKFGTSTAVNLYYKSAGKQYLLHFPYGFSVRVGRKC
jgi:hypothetical protein